MSMIKNIQTKLPLSIIILLLLILFQIILFFVYCIVYYVYEGSYIDQYYDPLKEILFHKYEISVGVNFGNIVFAELENVIRGSCNISDIYKAELYNILNSSLLTVIELFNYDRNINQIFVFSDFIQSDYVTYVDYNTYKVENMLLSDQIDIFVDEMNTVLKESNIYMLRDLINNIQRNYIYFSIVTGDLRTEITNEFLGSNNVVNDKVMISMEVLMIF